MAWDNLVQLAINQAKKARRHNNPFLHGSVAIRGNEVVGVGFNKPVSFTNDPNRRVQLHAELSSILGLPRHCLKDVELIVVRVTKGNGHLVNSKPCKKCVGMLRRKGIKKVWHSDADGNIVCCYL